MKLPFTEMGKVWEDHFRHVKINESSETSSREAIGLLDIEPLEGGADWR